MRKLTLVAATLIMAPLAALAGETPAAPGSVQYELPPEIRTVT